MNLSVKPTIHFFPHKFEFKIGYYKLWSLGQYNLSIPTVTKYCFNLFGLTIMFIRKGVY